jgi:hypothetical protein
LFEHIAMGDLQEINFEQVVDARAVASNRIRLHHDWPSSDSSSLGAILTHIQSPAPARPATSESSAHPILVFGAGVSFASLRENLIGASTSVWIVATAGEAVFTTTSHDSREIAKAKLKKLKAKHFSAEGREERVARSLEILSLPGPRFHADKETWIWAAEDADIEDI